MENRRCERESIANQCVTFHGAYEKFSAYENMDLHIRHRLCRGNGDGFG
jgi:hypothetical protein